MNKLRNALGKYETAMTVEERFWSKVDPCRTDGCALWLGGLMKGYGKFYIGSKQWLAHHFLVGKPPKGLVWDHVKERGCTHRNCIWPDHLELVTNRVNILRGEGTSAQNARKTACIRGHPYDGPDSYLQGGRRRCRACSRAYHQKETARDQAKRLARVTEVQA